MNLKELKTKTRAYALKNALAYKGKAQQGAIISSLFNEGLKKDEVKKFIKDISKIISEVNKLTLEEQKKEFEKLKEKVSEREIREGLPELPNVKKGKVVMRFAPSPSGAFHIGHALTASISFLYIKKYGGKFYVRIEDTNPENIYKPAYKLIKQDSDWLFDKKAKIIIQSERMNLYYKYAEQLIKKNSAYVCTCSGDKFREYVKEKKDCPCRKLSVKENLERWEKMLGPKGFKEGEAVLRFKSLKGMKDKNPAMRDFPLARINLTPHPLQKKKYRVWPLMNLSVTVDDIELKMTHIIRAKEHRDNAQRQEMIYKVLGKKFPWTSFLGRWHIKGLKLSASQITKDIESGKYSGWNDKRLPTVASLKKQGYKPQAFWKFSEQIGLSESDKTIDKEEFFKLLNAFNRDTRE
ncbi:glutamate--tRNA ligase [Candidatus Pacearchaeota archaeon]|nr:glutamate--tRNA ligase [Candidatus Pacearchaeota archaeon]